MTATVIATGKKVVIVNADRYKGSPIVLKDTDGNLYLPYELEFAKNPVPA